MRVSPWYLLFMAALTVGSVMVFREFGTAIMLLSIAGGDLLCQWLARTRQRKWVVPSLLAVALAFGGLCCVADLTFFPHSIRAAYRLKNAGINGALCSFAMLLAAYWWPSKKREP